MNILIVDDNHRDLERLENLLAGHYQRIEACQSGQQADLALSERGSDFALAILSWDMAGTQNGQELVVSYRKKLPDLRFVVMTQNLTANLAVLADRLGVKDFLSKPLDSAEVGRLLDSVRVAEQTPIPFLDELRSEIIGESKALLDTLRLVSRAVQDNKINVLIIGEPGTGKELIAQAIHRLSIGERGKIVSVNLSSIPDGLVADALFGHERGAFNNAGTIRKGYLEEAHNGTLFLDEIGELPHQVQVDLLRALQERNFQRLGSSREIPFDTRLICATNRDLAADVKAGKMRGDFYQRINGLTIHVPPLRERPGDIPILLEYFLNQYRRQRPVGFARTTLSILNSYPFPGNIRELGNIVNQALAKCDGEELLPQHLNLKDMGTLIDPASPFQIPDAAESSRTDHPSQQQSDAGPISFPEAWLKLPLLEAIEQITAAFSQAYLSELQNKHRHNKSEMSKAARVDRKTLDQYLKKAGLPSRKNTGSLPHPEE